MLRVLSLLIALVSVSSVAMNEEILESTYSNEITAYFDANSYEGDFVGKDQVKIAYRVFKVMGEKGAIVLLPGRGEPFHKYAELAYDLRDLGYSIYMMSHRGQGESARVKQCKIQYVESYDDYVSDLELFMHKVVNERPHANVTLLAHSMGGAIGTLYSLRHPNAFSGMILASPMFHMNTPPYPKPIARALAKLMVKLGFGQNSGGSDSLKVTSSKARQSVTHQILKSYSSIESQKISFGWAKASLDAIKKLHKADLSVLPPVLLLQAGKDLHVPSEGQDTICKKMPSCYKVRLPEAFHEILMEKDSIRTSALVSIQKFLARSK